jgi:hypothetical protein
VRPVALVHTPTLPPYQGGEDKKGWPAQIHPEPQTLVSEPGNEVYTTNLLESLEQHTTLYAALGRLNSEQQQLLGFGSSETGPIRKSPNVSGCPWARSGPASGEPCSSCS